MAAVKPVLEEAEAWNEKIEAAWIDLFKFICAGMQRGYETSTLSTTSATSGKQLTSKTSTTGNGSSVEAEASST